MLGTPHGTSVRKAGGRCKRIASNRSLPRLEWSAGGRNPDTHQGNADAQRKSRLCEAVFLVAASRTALAPSAAVNCRRGRRDFGSVVTGFQEGGCHFSRDGRWAPFMPSTRFLRLASNCPWRLGFWWVDARKPAPFWPPAFGGPTTADSPSMDVAPAALADLPGCSVGAKSTFRLESKGPVSAKTGGIEWL